MEIIYHITSAGAWEEARRTGVYAADSLATEGFIHLSTREQLLWVAGRYYAGQPGLVLLSVAAQRLTAELRYEESEPGQRFPHLYGPLNLDAVIRAHPLVPDPDGSFSMPSPPPGDEGP